MRKLIRSTPVVVAGICCLAFGSVGSLRELGALQWLELLAYDLLVRSRPIEHPKDDRIVVIGVGESDLNETGWPLTDETLATAIDKVLRSKPRVIGVDLYRDRSVPPGHDRLSGLLQRHDHIMWVSKFGDRRSRGVPPPKILEKTQRYGFADIVQDQDGVIRRGLLFLDDGVAISYGFALRLALHYLAKDGVAPKSGPDGSLRLGANVLVPIEAGFGGYVDVDSRGYQFMLDYRNGPSPFQQISLSAVLANKVAAGTIRDKIVLFGLTAVSVKDYFYTPFSRSEDIDQTSFGVILQAQMVAQLLRHGLLGHKPVAALDRVHTALWILIWALVSGFASLLCRNVPRFVTGAAIILVGFGTMVYAAFLYSWWLPAVPGLLATILSMAFVRFYLSRQDQAQRLLLMRLFSSHVSERVAEEIWRKREEFLEGGRPRPQRQVASVLFSDIRDFTSISEREEPQFLMDWLNEYMDVMAMLVADHGGVIEKFTGDGIMALFGVPLKRADDAQFWNDARNAVNCALAMRSRLRDLNAKWQSDGQPQIGIRIGINTGPLVVGSLGSADRMQYTAIGDIVNTAARLESLGKEVEAVDDDCPILIGEPTAKYVASEFEILFLGPYSLKGKDQAVPVYQVMRPTEVASEERSD